MSKFLKYCQKSFKTVAAKQKQTLICRLGRKIKAIDIKQRNKTFIVKDIEETKNILKREYVINDNVIQYKGFFIEQKKKVKLAAGEAGERNFVKCLKKFQGLVIDDETSFLFKKKGIKVNTGDKMIRVEQVGTKKDKESDSKKPDVMLFFESGKKIGISYKMDKSRTVQSWSTNKKWEQLLGKDNLKIIVKQMPKLLRSEINKKSKRTFLGITFHLTNNQKKVPLDRFIKNFDIYNFYFDSNTQLVFTGTNCNFKKFSDFLESSKLQNKEEILNDPTKKLYFDFRYIFSDTTSSNNSSQGLLFYKPNSNINNKHFNDTKEMLKNGSFVPYWENKDKTIKTLNTINLGKAYKKREITFSTKRKF